MICWMPGRYLRKARAALEKLFGEWSWNYWMNAVSLYNQCQISAICEGSSQLVVEWMNQSDWRCKRKEVKMNHRHQPKRFRQKMKTTYLVPYTYVYRNNKRRRGKEMLRTKTDDTTSRVFGFLLSLFQYQSNCCLTSTQWGSRSQSSFLVCLVLIY